MSVDSTEVRTLLKFSSMPFLLITPFQVLLSLLRLILKENYGVPSRSSFQHPSLGTPWYSALLFSAIR